MAATHQIKANPDDDPREPWRPPIHPVLRARVEQTAKDLGLKPIVFLHATLDEACRRHNVEHIRKDVERAVREGQEGVTHA
jgi:hypothetical protein